MELNHLKYFYEVARAGSFSGASRALRVTQPSISKMVKQLEEQQGVRLLDRGPRGGVHLTEAGSRFFASCERIFEEVGRLRLDLENGRTECTGQLALGASDNLCNYLLPRLLAGFSRAHPRVSFSLFNGTSREIRNELVERRIVLGLFHTPPRDPALEAECLLAIEFAVVVAGEGPRSLKELERLPYVGSRVCDYARPFPALRMLRELSIVPRLTYETNSQETQKRLVKEGLGYGVMPRFMVSEEIRRGELRAVRLPRSIGSEVYLVRRKGRTLAKTAGVFERYLRREMAAVPISTKNIVTNN